MTLVSGTVMASEDKWYTVEVISFTRSASTSNAERWSELPYQEDGSGGFSSADNLSPGSDLLSVPKEQWQLGPHAYSINRAPEMTVASHQAWRQKGLPRKQAPWIPLDTKANGIYGNIKISLSRYLHADVDIKLENPDRYNNQGFMPARDISFKTSKKIRLGKLFYIDHPLAGVIVLIERYQPEA
ncbi:MAG: CsiV family protein [Gammaproteobacteria bacterium]